MLLDRRGFLSGLPALLPAAVAAADESPRTRIYLMEQFLLQQGNQQTRIHDFLSKAFVPALQKIHKGPALFMDAVMAPHMPQVVMILGAASVEQLGTISRGLSDDRAFSKAFDEWEAGDPPYLQSNASVLAATDFSPEIVTPEKPPATPRIFELRTYHSHTVRQNRLLQERFSGAEIKIFHRSGVNPLFYSTTVFGEMKPNLTYVIPFESLAAREAAWAKFGADEEWLRVRRESIEKGGQLTPVQQMLLYKATAYSPVR